MPGPRSARPRHGPRPILRPVRPAETRHADRRPRAPRRHRRRRAHPVRALDGRVRRSEQPGHADRDACRRWSSAIGLQGDGSATSAPGAVLKHSRDFNLTRECVLSSGLPRRRPAFDLQRACGTSLETAIVIGMKIAIGQIDSGIAAGVDTASDVPIGVSEGLRRILLRSSRGAVLGERLAPWLGLRPRALQAAAARGRRAAHRALDGPELRADGAAPGRSRARSRTSSRSRATGAPPRRTTRASSTTWSSSSAGLKRDNNLRRDSTLEKLARAQALVSDGRQRHADRRQLDADDRRRRSGAARERGLGDGARPAGARATSRTASSRPSTSSTAKGC